MFNRTKIFSLTISLLLFTMLLSLSSCSQRDLSETPPSQDANIETSGKHQTPSAEVAASTSPDVGITPGSITFTTSAGEYWGLRGFGKTSPGKVLYDYATLKTAFLVKMGYNIRIDVADKIENLPAGKEMPEDGTSIDDYLEKIVADQPVTKKQIIVIYTGESNEIAVYAGEDVPKMNFDAIEASFQDESVADPVMRVMVGIKALHDELLSAEGLEGG